MFVIYKWSLAVFNQILLSTAAPRYTGSPDRNEEKPPPYPGGGYSPGTGITYNVHDDSLYFPTKWKLSCIETKDKNMRLYSCLGTRWTDGIKTELFIPLLSIPIPWFENIQENEKAQTVIC